MMDFPAARDVLLSCFSAAVSAVDPEEAVARSLDVESVPGRVVVFALGKAAPAMARGAARALGADELVGLVVSNHKGEVPPGMVLRIGSHPVPDESSVAAGRSLLDLAGSLRADDLAIVLISGGGSALAEVPVDGISLADLAATNEALLRSGADIVQVNSVRRRLSQFKGGGLAAAIAPARLVTLAVSDVIGDLPVAIASGPTVPSPDRAEAALEILEQFGLRDRVPESVLKTVSQPPHGRIVDAHPFKIVASGAVAAHAAAAEAERLGYPSRVVDTRLDGDAAAAAGEVIQRSSFGISVFAGETTVNVSGDGHGGRNQEAALVGATLIDGLPDVVFLAAGTDGIDGITPAAGAIVDGSSVARAEDAGMDVADVLARNDSGTLFATIGDQIVTGPTGTNVGDIWLVLRST